MHKLSIYSREVCFPVDISVLQNKFDELIVYSRLVGYKIVDHIWKSVGGDDVLRFDFDLDNPSDIGFTIEIVYDVGNFLSKEVNFHFKNEDHIYLSDNIEGMVGVIERMIGRYV